MNKSKDNCKIAIYDYNEEKVRYITGMVVCLDYAKTSTRIEVCVDNLEYVPLNKIVDTDRYNIGNKEMAELMMVVDDFFELIYQSIEKRSKRLKIIPVFG